VLSQLPQLRHSTGVNRLGHKDISLGIEARILWVQKLSVYPFLRLPAELEPIQHFPLSSR